MSSFSSKISRPPRIDNGFDKSKFEIAKWFDEIWRNLTTVDTSVTIIQTTRANITELSLPVTSYSGETSIELTQSDYMSFIDASSGSVTVILPLIAGDDDMSFTIKKTDSSGNFITITTTDANLLDGESSFSLEEQDESVTIQSDGTDWWII